MAIFDNLNNDEIVVPEDVQIDIDTDAAQEVEPNYQEIQTPEPAPEQEEVVEPEAETQEATEDNPETTPDQGEETPTAEGQEPEAESSLTDQPTEPEPDTAPAEVQEVELSDESVMKYLSEKLGKELTSLDELNQKQPDPLENDPELKEIAEWRERTGRPISDWPKYQKDFDAMSNEDIAREYLQHKYPDLTPEEVQLELEDYLPTEDDFDKDIAKKALSLKKLASDGRRELNTLRMELNNPLPTKLSPEQAQAVESYAQIQEQQKLQKEVATRNEQAIKQAVESFETIPLSLDKELSIEFKPPQEARQKLQEFMKMPNWYNPDGTLNAKEVVSDSFFLQNREAIIKEAYNQGVSNGLASIEKKTNNITLDSRQTQEGENPSKNDIEIEGLEDMLGTQMKIR